jgi:hypothetical protein
MSSAHGRMSGAHGHERAALIWSLFRSCPFARDRLIGLCFSATSATQVQQNASSRMQAAVQGSTVLGGSTGTGELDPQTHECHRARPATGPGTEPGTDTSASAVSRPADSRLCAGTGCPAPASLRALGRSDMPPRSCRYSTMETRRMGSSSCFVPPSHEVPIYPGPIYPGARRSGDEAAAGRRQEEGTGYRSARLIWMLRGGRGDQALGWV